MRENKIQNQLACDIVRDLLPLYHDGVASKTTCDAVQAHLKQCPACREEYGSLCREIPVQNEKPSTRRSFLAMMRRQKQKRLIFGITAVLLTLVLTFGVAEMIFVGNPVIRLHNRQLQKAVSSLENGQTVTLEQLVPFEWDRVYTFEPYTSREEIAQIIGFDSNSIQVSVNEGQLQLLFVKGNKITASVCGYPSSLGYDVKFGGEYGQDRSIQKEKNQQVILQAEKTENQIILREK